MKILNKINNFSLYMYKEGFSESFNSMIGSFTLPAAVVTWLLTPFSWPIIVTFHYTYKALIFGVCLLAQNRGKKLSTLIDKMSMTLHKLDLYKDVE